MKIMIVWVLGVLAFFSSYAQNPSDNTFEKYEQTVPRTKAKFTMVPIPAGSFMMGSLNNDKQKEKDETPQHQVQISAFWMGQHEVTYDEYISFFTDKEVERKKEIELDAVTRPTVPYIDVSHGMGKEGGFPACNMRQYGAMMYCKWLYNKTGVFYRLPTEAEWEYACRAGSNTTYPFGDNESLLKDYAWFDKNSKGEFHKVGEKKPNAWGLYDMLGNVSEWVLDQYQADYYGDVEKDALNPVNTPETRHPLVVRGGSYKDPAKELRSANRISSDLEWNRRDPQLPKSMWWNADAPFVGFRIVRPLKQPTPEEAEKFYKIYLGL